MENLTGLLSQLAEKLGTTVEFLWEILLKQAHISGWISFFSVIVFLVGITFFSLFIRYTIKKWDYIEENALEPLYAIINVLLGIIFIIWFILIILEIIPNMITAFSNPEYWALKQVLGIIR